MAYQRTYNSLSWCSLDRQQHEKTCGYWYVLQEHHGPHTAFRTREEFLAWAALYRLDLDADAVPQIGTHAYGRLSGQYRRTSHLSYDEFFAIDGERIRLMDNGEVTLGLVANDADGTRNVHHLNCNMCDRPKFERGAGPQVF